MDCYLNKFVTLLARYGVVSRDEIRSYASLRQSFIDRGLLQKVYQKGCVFFELTPKALPLLENHRKILVEKVQMMSLLCPWSRVYTALLGDVRFLDIKNPRAAEFLFLSDWQLKRPVVMSQVELAKMRFYEMRSLHENKAA